MIRISDQLNELVKQKNILSDTLNRKGVESSREEKFNTLIPKVSDIEGVGGSIIEKRKYSFGLLSDVHLKDTSMGVVDATDSVKKFNRVLDFYEDEGVEFVTIAGDILALNSRYPSDSNPLTNEEVEASESTYINEILLYKQEVEKRQDLPIHTVAGNHDVFPRGHYERHPVGMDYKITLESEGYREFKGKKASKIWEENISRLNYVEEVGDDVFIYHSMYFWNYRTYCRQEDIDWLALKLETFKDKRVFLVAHMPMPNIFDGLSTATGLQPVENSTANQFVGLLSSYPNVIQLSGHLHYVLSYEGMEGWTNPNTHRIPGGATVLRCSSGAYTRSVGDPYVNNYDGAQGYIVDVYDSKIVVRGFDYSSENIFVMDKPQYVITN